MEVRFQNSVSRTRRTMDYVPPDLYGGAEGDRTPDLLNAIQALSQLSYNPTFEFISS